MPQIFTKNCKITVIEYGHNSKAFDWKSFKADIQNLIKSIIQ